MAGRLDETRALFTRSVVARRELPAGEVLTAEDLAVKKPGGGLPPQLLTGLLGRRSRAAVAADQPLAAEDVEPPAI